MADRLREHIFEKLFEIAEIAKFTPDQIRSYKDSLKYFRDLKNSLDAANAKRENRLGNLMKIYYMFTN